MAKARQPLFKNRKFLQKTPNFAPTFFKFLWKPPNFHPCFRTKFHLFALLPRYNRYILPILMDNLAVQRLVFATFPRSFSAHTIDMPHPLITADPGWFCSLFSMRFLQKEKGKFRTLLCVPANHNQQYPFLDNGTKLSIAISQADRYLLEKFRGTPVVDDK